MQPSLSFWRRLRPALIHGGLFLVSFFTMLMAGAELSSGKYWIGWGGWLPASRLLHPGDVWLGLSYAAAFMAFLTFHEFGHYFTARYHKVSASLPYYLPLFFPLPGVLNIGTLGAVIRLRQVPKTTRQFFDIGIAGPLAGFVVSLLLLTYGFTHLPDKQPYVLEREPDYALYFGGVPDEEELHRFIVQKNEEGEGVMAYLVGTNLLFEAMKALLVTDPAQVPSHFDLIHYPFLFVGYITLFFTALNMLPMGQLDGGHVAYGMFGRRNAGVIARVTLVMLLLVGGTGLVRFGPGDAWEVGGLAVYGLFLLYAARVVMKGGKWWQNLLAAGLLFGLQGGLASLFPALEVNAIWLVYSVVALRIIGLDHPPATWEERVSGARRWLGWLAFAIFVLSFSPAPLRIIGG